MAEIRVFWTEVAINERNKIFEYWNYRNQSISFSRKLNFKIQDQIQLLKQNPELGIKVKNFNARTLTLGHYNIIYQIRGNEIYIISFWDNRQNPNKLLASLKK